MNDEVQGQIDSTEGNVLYAADLQLTPRLSYDPPRTARSDPLK